MPEYLSSKKRKQSIGINSYSEYTDTTKIIGNVLVGFGSVGVGTTVPTQDVDVNTIRVRDTLYDYTNSGGEFGYYLVKDTDGIKWVAVPPIDSNAIFVAENNNILGVSSFTGLNIIADELLGVTPNPINPNFADITIIPRWLKSGETGIYTTKNVGIGTTIPTTDFQVGFGTTGVTIDGSIGVVSALGYYGNYAFIDQITVKDQLNVVGLGSTLVAAFLASAGGITTTGGDLYVGGTLFADRLDIENLEVVNINATGITTLNVGIVSTLTVTGITTLGVTSTKDLYVDENLYVVGIATANRFSTGETGSAINITSNTISGPAEIIIDPADVGDNSGAVRIKGDLFVDGEEFIVNSTTIELADFNVGIASTVGTNLLLDGAGIGIGSTNIRKTLTYDYSSDSLKSSENFDLESGKVYKINEVEVLSSTQLTIDNINSSGISTLGFATIGQLYVSGVSTFVGVGTFIDDLYVGDVLYADIVVGLTSTKDLLVDGDLNVTGVSTFVGFSTFNDSVEIEDDLFVRGNTRTLGITTLAENGGITTTGGDLYVGEVLYADVVVGLTSTTDLLVDGDLNVTGISTFVGFSTFNDSVEIEDDLFVRGNTRTLGITTLAENGGITTTGGNLFVGGVLYAGTVNFDSIEVENIKATGISTLNVGIVSTLTVTGITTLGVTSTTNLTSQELNVSGITTLGVTSTTNLTSQELNVTGVSTFNNIVGTSLSISGISTLGVTTITQLYVSGVSTFSDRITGIISTATKLETPRSFEITGDVVASPIFFDGTGNVSLAATIQPNSVGLGTDTFGDYVKDIDGTANEITVTGGTGEGSSPIISFAPNPTIGGNVTIGNDLQVNNNLNVTGNITVGGTSATLFTQTLTVADKDIILGLTTDPTDTTANHGGIAIASTEGNPLVTLTNPGIGETLPATYKKFMWFKAGSFAGLNTDAWLSNYAIGIGSTQFPTGTRLAAGSVQFTENDLAVVRNINASGVVTATKFKGTLEGYADRAGIATYADNAGITTHIKGGSAGNVVYQSAPDTTTFVPNSSAAPNQVLLWNGSVPVWEYLSIGSVAGIVTYAERAGIAVTVIGGIASVTSLDVSGITTLASIVGTSLSITGISTIANFRITNVGTGATVGGIGVVTYYGDGSNLINVAASSGYATTAGIATYAERAGISTNVIGGIASVSQLYVSGVSTFNNIVGTALSISGISTIANFLMTPVGTGATVGGIGVVTYYGDGSNLTGVSALNVTQQDLTASPVYPTFANGVGSTSLGISTTQVVYIPTSGNLGIGSTQPTSKLTVQGDVLVSGVLTAANLVGTALSISGISTIANFRITNVGTGATVGGIGVVTYYGDGSKLENVVASSGYATTAGIATYAERAGIATDVIGGIASVSQLYVNGISTFTSIVGTALSISGISTLGVTSTTDLTTQQLYVSGVSTFTSIVGTSLSITGISTIANFRITNVGTGATVGGIGVTYYGDGSNLINVVASSGYATTAGIATYAERAGISTDVIGGIASVSQLYVTGISTFNNIVGTSLSITGISTIANLTITNVGTGATVGGIGVVTYYGDGSNLSGVSALNVTQQDLTASPVYPTFANGVGSTSLGISTTQVAYIPASGNLGIGSTQPTSKLTVQGDVLVSGVLTATRLYSTIYGEFVGGAISGDSIVGTALSISGISTLGTVEISSGIITATTGIVTYYGDGSNLTNVVGGLGGIGTAGGTVGTGITFLDFRGVGVSSITASAGIATITIPGSSRTVSTYTAAAGETSFNATYTVDADNRYVDVYLNGAKLSSAEYTATNGTSIELTEGASAGDIVEIIGYSINNIVGGSSTPDISPVMMGMIF